MFGGLFGGLRHVASGRVELGQRVERCFPIGGPVVLGQRMERRFFSLGTLGGRLFEVIRNLLPEDRGIATIGRGCLGAASPPLRQHASRAFAFRRVPENWSRQDAYVGGRCDNAQRSRERRVVLRREQRRDQDEIRHPVADGVERVCGRVGEQQLRADTPDHTRELGGLAPVRLDGENERHSRFAA